MTTLTKESILAELENKDGSAAFASIIFGSGENVADLLAKAASLSAQLKEPVAFIHDNKVFVTDGNGHDPRTGRNIDLVGGGIGHISAMEVAALTDIAKPSLRADGQVWQELLDRPDDHMKTVALLDRYLANALVSSERGGRPWTEVVQAVREHQDEHAEAIVLIKPYLDDALSPSETKGFVAHIRNCPECHDRVVALEISDTLDKNKQPPGSQRGL
jgi:Putative zinc-finger